MLARIALFAVLGSAPVATAAPAPLVPVKGGDFTLRGKGVRGGSTLGGTLVRNAKGSVSGDFVIIITTADDTATSCRYQKFAQVKRIGQAVSFDGFGVCTTVTPAGAITVWKAHNQFSVVQGAKGSVDTIDVNMVGATGITIPGGALDSGDFELL
jgi:hypothetical protein